MNKICKSIMMILLVLVFSSCDEHIRIGAKGRVSGVSESLITTTADKGLCFYTIEVPAKQEFYSEDLVVSTILDSCGKFQIGDSITLKTEKSRLTDRDTDTTYPSVQELPTAVQ
jgi:hypothetical protein